ncbi:MAG: DUF1587 domain-containing protein, partial [Planctomycetaceae bacterium]
KCHGPDTDNAGLRLDKYASTKDLLVDRKTWIKVLQYLELGAMPPPDFKNQPDARQRRQIVKYLDKTLFAIDCDMVRDPGRVTIRRLNRSEYNNTIRDLVGVDFQPAKNFPSDDVGEGFDNIGDVLSVSPLLIEKYLDAAEQISSKAIVSIDPFKTRNKKLANKAFNSNANATPRATAPSACTRKATWEQRSSFPQMETTSSASTARQTRRVPIPQNWRFYFPAPAWPRSPSRARTGAIARTSITSSRPRKDAGH